MFRFMMMSAQVAIQENHWDAALDSTKQAQAAAHLTAKDEYNIDALLACVLYRQNKCKQAAAVYELPARVAANARSAG
jgi:hypothetical protein